MHMAAAGVARTSSASCVRSVLALAQRKGFQRRVTGPCRMGTLYVCQTDRLTNRSHLPFKAALT